MQTNDDRQVVKSRRRALDLPALIKYILLFLLLLLLIGQLANGDIGRLQEGNFLTWLILILKLLLIAILIWLIRVQRGLTCEVTAPTGCTDEEINQTLGGLTVEVVGSAGGAPFSHYTLEWRKVEGQDCQNNADWSSDGVHYPGGGGNGGSPVTNGTLGWLDTTVWPAGSYEVRLCVYSVYSSQPTCCCSQFNLFKQLVWIERVAIDPGAPVLTPPGPFVGNAPVVDSNPGGTVVPVGGCVTIEGSAWVGECNNRKIKCFDLRYAPGFLPGPFDAGFNPAAYTGPDTGSLLPAAVCYEPPEEAAKRAQWNWVIGRALTTQLVKTQITILGNTYDVWKLKDFCFNSAVQLPACPDAQHHCRSGQFTLMLQVEDTLGNMYYDTQQVWFDNKPIHAEFGGIGGLAACTDLHLDAGGPFVPPGAPCSVPWPAEMRGIAYDEYIDEADLSYPSDNFDYYWLRITRQGGPTYQVPITPSLVPPVFGPNPLHGTSRVGEPGERCEESIPGCMPVNPVPPKDNGLLTMLDLRVFDAVCAPSLVAPFTPPAGFALGRGECCGYTFQLFARDKTWSDGWSGGYHRQWSLPWAVCICNDLPQVDED
jgi:hypothetical protein